MSHEGNDYLIDIIRDEGESMKTFEVTYTWSGTLKVKAEDENAAVEKAWKEMMAHPAPMNLFDYEDDTMEVRSDETDHESD